jgi:hypothetical protein
MEFTGLTVLADKGHFWTDRAQAGGRDLNEVVAANR